MKITSRSGILIVLIISWISLAIYILSLKAAYPLFQDIQLTQPLASLQALFPLFYIAVFTLLCAAILNILFKNESRMLNIWLLLVFAVMLWYTPHALAGTTYQLDGLRCVAASNYIPEIFQGDKVLSSTVVYCRQYPLSFIVNWIFISGIGINTQVYLNIIYPLFYLCFFVILVYIIVKDLINDRTAFIALLVTVPGLHYIQIYPCPHTMGMLMALPAIFFMIRKRGMNLVMVLLLSLATALAHPVTALILLIFMGSFLLTTLLKERGKWQIALTAIMLFSFAVSLLLYKFPVIPETSGIAVAPAVPLVSGILDQVNLDILSRTWNYLFGAAFIFNWIYNLARVIYFVYAIFGVTVLCILLFTGYRRAGNFRKWLTGIKDLNSGLIFFVLSTFFLMVFTLFLGALKFTGYDLIERSLSFLILTLSAIISYIFFSYEIKLPGTVKNICYILLLLIVTAAFPLVSYSKDAYTSMPVSEKSGLDYLYNNNLITSETEQGQKIIVPEYQTAHSYVLSGMSLDHRNIYIFRMTGYYYYSMRIDLSFTINKFLEEKEMLSHNPEYNNVYLNRTTDIYYPR